MMYTPSDHVVYIKCHCHWGYHHLLPFQTVWLIPGGPNLLSATADFCRWAELKWYLEVFSENAPSWRGGQQYPKLIVQLSIITLTKTKIGPENTFSQNERIVSQPPICSAMLVSEKGHAFWRWLETDYIARV